MKIPQHPPDIYRLLDEKGSSLFKEVSEPPYQEFLHEVEARYLHWDKLRHIAAGKGLDPETIWVMSKIGRINRYRKLPLQGAMGRSVVFVNTDRMLEHLMLIDQELSGPFVSDTDTPLEPSQRERFIVGALREEAISSSMLEGASTTRVEAKKLLRTGRRPKTRGERMVVNNYRAIMFIREHRNTNLSTDFLLQLQTMLTEGTLDEGDNVGRLRTDVDGVEVVDSRDGEVIHVPPPADELPARLQALFDFANSQDSQTPFVHPVLKACMLHFQLGFDHPFCDGNGRTARALFYWYMLRSKYWLFEYLPISRFIYKAPIKYTRAYLYTETDDFDATYFLHYHVAMIAKAREELQEFIKKRQRRMMQARRLLASDPSLNHRQQELLLEATRNPYRVFTIDGHQSRHNVVYETARQDLLGLAESGYFDKRKEGKRWIFLSGPRISEVDGSSGHGDRD